MQRLQRLLPVAACALAAACASTDTRHAVESETFDEAWRGRAVGQVLVVAMFPDPGHRVSAETAFCARAQEAGVDARSGYEAFPDLSVLEDEAALRSVLNRQGCDTVLTVTLLDEGESFDYEDWAAKYAAVRLVSSGFFTRMQGYSDYYESGKYVLDLGLWDAATLDPVWHATTDSYSLEGPAEDARKFGDFFLGELDRLGLKRGADA